MSAWPRALPVACPLPRRPSPSPRAHSPAVFSDPDQRGLPGQPHRPQPHCHRHGPRPRQPAGGQRHGGHAGRDRAQHRCGAGPAGVCGVLGLWRDSAFGGALYGAAGCPGRAAESWRAPSPVTGLQHQLVSTSQLLFRLPRQRSACARPAPTRARTLRLGPRSCSGALTSPPHPEITKPSTAPPFRSLRAWWTPPTATARACCSTRWPPRRHASRTASSSTRTG